MSLCNVNIGTGAVYYYSVDFVLRGFIPLRFVRDYDSTRKTESALGHGWRFNHDRTLHLADNTAFYIAPDRVIPVPHPDIGLHVFTKAHYTIQPLIPYISSIYWRKGFVYMMFQKPP